MTTWIGAAARLPGHPRDLPDFTFAWLEGIVCARLVTIADAQDWQDAEQWLTGRVFGTHGEYRWRVDDEGALHAVLILDDSPLPPPFDIGALRIDAAPEKEACLLWGEWVDPEQDRDANPDGDALFYAPPIPGVMPYPVAPGTKSCRDRRACITALRYRHPQAGEFLRYADIRLMDIDNRGQSDASG